MQSRYLWLTMWLLWLQAQNRMLVIDSLPEQWEVGRRAEQAPPFFASSWSPAPNCQIIITSASPHMLLECVSS